MVYTITVEDTTEQAMSFINFIKTLAHDYNFLRIEPIQETNILSKEQEIELDRRFEYVLQNPTEGKSWEEVECMLLKK